MKLKTAIATIFFSSQAFALGPHMSLANQEAKILAMMLSTCAIEVKTMFVQIRSKTAPDESTVSRCAEDGKATVKSSYEKIKASFGKNKIPAELTEWRLEWMAAFDSSIPANGEIERAYLERQNQSYGKINRATNRLEVALE